MFRAVAVGIEDLKRGLNSSCCVDLRIEEKDKAQSEPLLEDLPQRGPPVSTSFPPQYCSISGVVLLYSKHNPLTPLSHQLAATPSLYRSDGDL